MALQGAELSAPAPVREKKENSPAVTENVEEIIILFKMSSIQIYIDIFFHVFLMNHNFFNS